MNTFGKLSRQPAHRSFWRIELERRAGPLPLDVWLVEQANRRGIWGAFGRCELEGNSDPHLTLEDIVVGLLMPHAEVDGRLFKLVVRILQSGRIDGLQLLRLARQQRADHVLWWLVSQLPPGERTPVVEGIVDAFGGPPRGFRPPAYRYDAQRLVRRPFRSEEGAWTRRQQS